ncbi:MAG: hypothetical protein PSV22_19375, partial [Pseudolabrys sp.]|nr:hypothetical protein [Pseudolabrys sp.]
KKGYGARPKLSATTETRSFCNTLSMARDRKRNLLLGLYERAQSMGPGMVKQFAESFLDPFTK